MTKWETLSGFLLPAMNIITVNSQKCRYKSADIIKVIDGNLKDVK